MSKIVITSGQPFTDIDALACAVAYNELLIAEGKDSEVVLPGPLNKSVTKKIKDWKFDYKTEPWTTEAKFVLVDISDPKFFADFVEIDKIIGLFDHSVGFRKYWQERLGENSKIELIGACATLIWEEFKKSNKQDIISEVSANLLATTIVSNTLNFQAAVTKDRDINAYEDLRKHVNLPRDWIQTYFTDQDKETEEDLKSAIVNDTKDIKPIIAQLELWDSKKIIDENIDEIENILDGYDTDRWFLTAPSIS